ncbi:4'-phosphopantetheinyl transferase family protein [Streptomyces pacificus]|uniref:4'-phosphopantetheinyl transferase family protein n=1 Tax=Streptomyces pacificus TaxID=2705029 RepID=UPI001564EB20|nr:4'-phosphopantetheinyl transferase superfamily protein [Streptomyces pacificus]
MPVPASVPVPESASVPVPESVPESVLASAPVLLWCVSTRAPDRVVRAARLLLPAADRERMARLRYRTDQDAFALSRAVLRRCLGALTGEAPAELRFTRRDNGKPEVAGAGQGSGLAFSLSHTAGLTLLAVTWGGPVGIDVERVRQVAAARIAARYFPADEAAAVAARSGHEAWDRFFRLWVRKEACVKVWGGRLREGLRTPVHLAVPGPATVQGPGGRLWRVRDLACAAAPYRAAVALPREARPPYVTIRQKSVAELLEGDPTGGGGRRCTLNAP